MDMPLSLQFPGRLGQKAVIRDDKALVGALTDLARLVIGGHLQLDALAVHQGDLALRPDPDAYGGGRRCG